MENLGINLGFLIVQILNFAIIFIVLKAWVYKPLTNMLEERRKKIAQGLEDARVAADARANAEEEATKIISSAQSKAADVIKEATVRAEAAQKEFTQDAQKEIEKARKDALAHVEEERNRLLSEMRSDVSAIAIAAAQKLIGESLDEKRQRDLLAEFFSGVKDDKVLVLDGKELTGAVAEVTSALPLTEAEQDKLKANVLSQVGGAASISFRVDPSILGGIILRVGDRVVDGSVAGQLDSLKKSLV